MAQLLKLKRRLNDWNYQDWVEQEVSLARSECQCILTFYGIFDTRAQQMLAAASERLATIQTIGRFA